ncbi:hypothetical protein [Lacticaseibacillus sp. GG6-2]
MATVTKQTLEQRLPLLDSVPQHIVRALPAGKVADYWEMASIGMPDVLAQKVTFTDTGEVAAVTPMPLASALTQAKTASGFLLQDEAEAGVYFATTDGDIAIVASKALCRSEDCHCG